MKQVRKNLLVASLIATLGMAAFAQMPSPPAGGPGPAGQERMGGPMAGRMGHGDPAKMQARMGERHAKHMADLKVRLQISPAQESVWTAFAASMQPSARPKVDRDQFRAEMEKLTTPERIDKMQALKAQRDATMTQRANAVKTFYAALTPAQQKVFDLESLRHGRMGQRGGHHDGQGMGMGHGMGHGMGMGSGRN
jgi:Spy/CpxP family protein refolding chaperone